LQSIQVTPATPTINSVAPGNTQQFKATGSYSDGSSKDLTAIANWLSSSTSVATITTGGLATGAGGGTATISAAMSGVNGTTTLQVVALQSITVTPANPSVSPNSTQPFTATGNYSDSSTKNLTSTVTWTATAGATITSAGLATGKTPGAQSTITATSGSISGSTLLTVTNPLVSIAVTPPSATINPVAPNNTQQFTAVGTYADSSTQTITASVNWQSSNSQIAGISGGGLATGVGPGPVTISASLSGVTGNASLTVTNPLQTITVTPANSTVAPLTKPQFTATGKYFDNTSNDITTLVAWVSSNTNVATISNGQGTQGLATTKAGGQTTITATCTPPSTACPTGNAVSGNTLLTVTSAVITGILVTPANAPIALGLQQQYDALATFNDGSQQDVTNVVTWASSDNAKITITTSGLATGVAVTTTPVTISATAPNSVVGSTTATVNSGNLVSIAIKPGNVTTLAQGTSQQYSAIGTFSNGSTLDITNQVTWSSSDTTIATVAQKTGLVQAAATVPNPTNKVTISATLSSVSQQLALTVTNATPSTITVTPVTAVVQVGANQAFHATAVFSDGSSQDVSLNSTWTSSSPAEAKVTFPGRLLGVSPTPTPPGTAPVTVTATFLGISGTASLDVSTATLLNISLTPSSINLAPGSSASFQAIGNYSDGSSANLSGLATWASTNTNVATVSNGVVLGQSAGQASVTAVYQNTTGGNPNNVVVTSSPLASISITPAGPNTYIGVAIQLTATGTTQPVTQPISLTQSATWASSNSTVATVSNAANKQGQSIGVSQGSTTITAVFAGVTGSTTLNVSNATITQLVITPKNSTISVGTNQSFKAVGTFSDGKQLDLTSQVTWSSSTANVAPINNAGTASGATTGTTTITATFQQPGQAPITVSDSTTLTVQ
jgi:hypothetical protein